MQINMTNRMETLRPLYTKNQKNLTKQKKAQQEVLNTKC